MKQPSSKAASPMQGPFAALALASLALLPACGDAAAYASDELPERITAATGLELVLVPAGSFEMGSESSDVMRRPDELPRHTVRFAKPLYVGTTEVTVGQFRQFVEETGYVTEAEEDPRGGVAFDLERGVPKPIEGVHWDQPGFEQTDEHPVVQESWIDAEAFCRWLGEKDGRTYRLPTEAEWEHFARAGTTTRWWFGDDPAGLREAGNVSDASLARAFPAVDWVNDWDDGYPFTAPVKGWKPNPWGLYDVVGNSWEWCADWHDEDYYANAPELDPIQTVGGTMRAIRGGGWYDPDWRTRSAQRAWFFPVFRYCMLSGFRIVAEVD